MEIQAITHAQVRRLGYNSCLGQNKNKDLYFCRIDLPTILQFYIFKLNPEPEQLATKLILIQLFVRYTLRFKN